jgi:hypothetical protein
VKQPDRWLRVRDELNKFMAMAREELKKRSPQPEPIISLGDGHYQIGAHPAITVEDNEDAVLHAFLRAPGHTLSKEALIAATDGIKNAPRILQRLSDKYDGIFAPAIICPGHRGGGGYRVKIEAAPGG